MKSIVLGTMFVLAMLVSSGACAHEAHSARVPWGVEINRQEADWYTSAEALEIASNVVRHQAPDGGWPKNTDLSAPPTGDAASHASTIDNNGTTLPVEYLARVVNAGGQDFRPAFQRGLEYLLAAQYPNGGWPQYYPLRGGYYDQITFNDDAMVRVLILLRDVAAGRAPYGFVGAADRVRAAAAVDRGIDLILRAQVRQDGVLTAWCAQHDRESLAPVWARAYEPPSLSGAESVGIVAFLMSIEDPRPEVVASVEAAVTWLRSAAIYGVRVETFVDAAGQRDRRIVTDLASPAIWARFYELGTNRPIFLGRDSVVRYNFAEIERERRAGYNYYGVWGADLLNAQYPSWKARLGL